jgi:hypothetical protein
MKCRTKEIVPVNQTLFHRPHSRGGGEEKVVPYIVTETFPIFDFSIYRAEEKKVPCLN